MKGTADLSNAVWRKSSYSDGGANNCVEVADAYAGVVPVRDSKFPDERHLVLGAGAWTAFVESVKGSSAAV